VGTALLFVPRQTPEPGVFEDDRRLDMGYLWLGRESSHRDVSKVIGVSYRHMDEEIVVASHVVERNHLVQLRRICSEPLDLACLVTVKTHGDHRLKPNSHDGGFDLGMEATKHSSRFQTPNPLRASRLRDSDRGRYLLV